MKTKFVILILIAGLLTACTGQPTEIPASPSTEAPAPATETPFVSSASGEAATSTIEPTAEPAPSGSVSFSSDILPIFDSRCVNCHGGEKIQEGLNMKSYSDLMAGSDNGPVVIPGDADGSLLAELILNNKMPKRGPKLTPPQVQLIIDWINQGALDN